jgi:ankyrin repeat protein
LKQEYIIVSFTTNNNSMSQADIDAFVHSAHYGTLTPQGVTAAVARGIPVNGRDSNGGYTALHFARELVVALLAAGADANVKNNIGATAVLLCVVINTADILQLLIYGGGSVNEPDEYGNTPLIGLAMMNSGNAPVRLQVLLARPELDLDAKYDGRTAEEWAVRMAHFKLAVTIAEECGRRVRWSAMRCAWVSATARN